jgi:hypothetical protein
MITIFCLALFDQFGFKLLFSSKEDRVKLAHFFQLIFKNLGLRHPLLLQPSEIDPCLENV